MNNANRFYSTSYVVSSEITGDGNTTLIASPGAGKRIVIEKLSSELVNTDTGAILTISDGTTTFTKRRLSTIGIEKALEATYDADNWQCALDSALTVNIASTSSACSLYVSCRYHVE